MCNLALWLVCRAWLCRAWWGSYSFPPNHAVLFLGPSALQASTLAGLLARLAGDSLASRDFGDWSFVRCKQSLHLLGSQFLGVVILHFGTSFAIHASFPPVVSIDADTSASAGEKPSPTMSHKP